MEELKTINIKDLMFILFRSWRLILACILGFALIAAIYTRILPIQYITPEPKKEEVESTEKTTAPIFIWEENEPEKLEDKYGEIEIQKMLQDFALKNREGININNQINALNDSNKALRDSLKSDLYLQIDPENRVNKRLVVHLTLDKIAGRTEFEHSVAKQNLGSFYMNSIKGNSFYQRIVAEGLVSYEPDDIKGLFQVRMTPQGGINIVITGPEEELRETLYRLTIEEIERINIEDVPVFLPHKMKLEELEDETVKDSFIDIKKSETTRQIKENEEEIERLQEQMREALDRQHKFDLEYQIEVETRLKQEVVDIIADTMRANTVKENAIKNLTKAIMDSNIKSEELQAIADDIIIKYKTTNKEEDTLNEIKALYLTSDKIKINRNDSVGKEPMPLVPQPKKYKRNIFLGAFLGLMLGTFLTIWKHWKELAGYDVKDITSSQKLFYIGEISGKHPNTKSKKGILSFVDSFIDKVFDKQFSPEQQEEELTYVHQIIKGLLIENKDVETKIVVPGVLEDLKKNPVFDRLKTIVQTEDPHLELKAISDLQRDSDAVKHLRFADAVLFVRSSSDDGDNFVKEVQLAKGYSIPIIGVVELTTKW